MIRHALTVMLILLMVACATSPLGRKQLKLMPASEMDQMGVSAYQQIKQQEPIDNNPEVNQYVSCVAHAITGVINKKEPWQVTVFQNKEANAFALPGGNIGVYSGMLDVAKHADQLAAVIGHEVGHVVAGHANDRVSTQFATQTGLDLLATLSGVQQSAEKQQIMGLLGVGAQLGIILPYSRKQESEADLLGLDYMAEAGFNPKAAIQLWQNMEKQTGSGPPAFLSTHPSGDQRIKNLEERLPHAEQLYQTAESQGKHPDCRAPGSA